MNHISGRQGDIKDPIQPRMQGRGKFAADGGFTGACLTSDKTDGTQFQEVFKACLGLGDGGGGIEFLGVEGALEGPGGEGKIFAVHGSIFSNSFPG
uniref:Uncharacterized protein n=1 Tax=Candidatus Kentrum sp. TUN TaxID=2126343 RepID=A0A451AC64_9GAMM|nr:MAG: hypothetical protein BECKTUN1418F_GA0071002_13992 [Candidatus Kentron sp. TUN]